MSRLMKQQGSICIPPADESDLMQPKPDKGVPPKLWAMLRYRLDNAAAAEWVELPFKKLNGRNPRQVFETPGPPSLSDVQYLVKDIHNHYLGVTTDRLYTADEIMVDWEQQHATNLNISHSRLARRGTRSHHRSAAKK